MVFVLTVRTPSEIKYQRQAMNNYLTYHHVTNARGRANLADVRGLACVCPGYLLYKPYTQLCIKTSAKDSSPGRGSGRQDYTTNDGSQIVISCHWFDRFFGMPQYGYLIHFRLHLRLLSHLYTSTHHTYCCISFSLSPLQSLAMSCDMALFFVELRQCEHGMARVRHCQRSDLSASHFRLVTGRLLSY